MTESFSAFSTMIVFLRGHPLLESVFGVSDCRLSANDFEFHDCRATLQCRAPEFVDHRVWD